MKTQLITITILLFIGAGLRAQINTVYLNNNEAASQWKGNPAFHGNEKVSVSILPVIGSLDFGISHTGFNYNQLINSNYVDPGRAIGELQDDNHFLLENRFDVVTLGIRIGNNQFRGGMQVVNDMRFSYPKDFVELLWKGNGHEDVIGRQLDFSGLSLNALSYYDYFVGYSRRFMDDKLYIGANLHYLQGIETVYSKINELSFQTNEQDYTLTASGDFEILTSIPPDTVDIDEGRYIPTRGVGNRGASVDFGVMYSYSERLTFQFSAMNLGAISWGDDSRAFVLEGTTSSYSGFDLEDLYDDDDPETSIEQSLDSLADALDLQDIQKAFNTPTNSRFLIGADYKIGKKNHLMGAYSYMRSFGTGFHGLAAVFNRDFHRVFSAQTGIQLFNFRHIMVPLAFQFNPGPVQLGVGTNNVISLIDYKASSFGSLHFSLSFRFGKDRRKPRVVQSEE